MQPLTGWTAPLGRYTDRSTIKCDGPDAPRMLATDSESALWPSLELGNPLLFSSIKKNLQVVPGTGNMFALNLRTHRITCVVSDKSTCDISQKKCPNAPSTTTAEFFFFLLRHERFLTCAMSAYWFLSATENSPFRSQRRGLPVSSRHPTPPQGPARIILSLAPPSALPDSRNACA